MKSIKEALSSEISIKVDVSLYKDFQKYVMGIYTRDDDHVKFLTGNLIGIHTPYFFKTDENYFWDSIMEVDKVDLSREFHHPETIVHKEWNIAGDLMNNAMAWLIHLILNSKDLNAKEKEAFAKEVLVLFQYKFLTSKIFRDYGLGANPATAAAAYDSLPRHFLIKKCDSWMEYFRYRADLMWEGEGKRKDMMGHLKSYDNDVDITNVVNGIANNMNTMIKAYNARFYALHEEGRGISSSSSITLDSEGVENAADVSGGMAKYMRLIDSRISIKNEFYSDDILGAILDITTARRSKVHQLLAETIDNYGRDKDIDGFITNGCIFAFTQLFDEGIVVHDIAQVVNFLLGKLSARRSGNAEYDLFDKHGTRVLKAGIGNNKHGVTARNIVLIYTVVWALITHREV